MKFFNWLKNKFNRESPFPVTSPSSQQDPLPESPQPQTSEAQVYFLQGNQVFNSEGFTGVISAVEQQLQIQPHYDEVLYSRGTTLPELANFESVINSYQQAVQIQPHYPQAWNNLGVALFSSGQYEQAIASFDQALRLQPDNSLAWYNRGVSLGQQGQYEQAIASFDQVVHLKPHYYQAWINRGNALGELKRYEEAITSYDQALQLQSDLPLAWINRAIAARQSTGCDINVQQQFVSRFQADFANSRQKLAAAFEAGDGRQKLREFINAPLPEAFITQLEKDWRQHPFHLNPLLNQRGAQGQIASLQAPIDKAIRRDSHPEAWGQLYHHLGQAHYGRGRTSANPYPFWRKALISYRAALQTLTQGDFPHQHLELLQDLIRVLIDLDNLDEARELCQQGAALRQRLLADPQNTPLYKQKLALRTSIFDQASVDLAVQSGKIATGWQLAETSKNTSIQRIFGTETISDPEYSQIQAILTSSTAAIYWHLSASVLTTFLILPGSDEAILAENKCAQERRSGKKVCTATLQQVLEWEKWLQQWNEQYQEYTAQEQSEETEKQGKQRLAWRKQLRENLAELAVILNIEAIEQALQEHNITNLVLIPHRDLHRVPLHYLLDKFTCTYLPSAQIGVKLRSTQIDNPLFLQNALVVNTQKEDSSQLSFGEVEAELMGEIFADTVKIANQAVTHDALQQALSQPQQIFHFNGQANDNSFNPQQSCLRLNDTDKFTLGEILEPNIVAPLLVSLPACESATINNQAIADEYVGLVNAFIQAGSQWVVNSLWKVESDASMVLMVEFYQQLQAGKAPAVALREAQQWLQNVSKEELQQWFERASATVSGKPALTKLLQKRQTQIRNMKRNKPYRNPYHWAAFIISGQPKF